MRSPRWIICQFRFLLFVAVLLVSGSAAAQFPMLSKRYSISLLTQTNTDFQQNSVLSVVKDSKGELWILTPSNIATFDGRKVINRLESTGLDRFIGLYNGEGDSLYLITDNRKVIKLFNGKVAAIHNIRENGDLYFSQPDIWIGSNFFKEYDTAGIVFPEFAFYNIHRGGQFRSGEVLFVQQDSVFIYAKGKPPVCLKLIRGVEQDIVSLNSNELAFITKDRQMLLIDRLGQQKLIPLSLPGSVLGNLNLFSSKGGSGFFILCGKQLFKAVMDGSRSVQTEEICSSELFRDEVTCVFAKDDMRIMVGTKTKGLILLTQSHFISSKPPGNSVANYYAQVLLPDGRTVLTGNNHFYTDGKFAGSLEKPVLASPCYSIIKDRKGEIWLPELLHENIVYHKYTFQGTHTKTKVPVLVKDFVPQYCDMRGKVWGKAYKRPIYVSEDLSLFKFPDIDITGAEPIFYFTDKRGKLVLGSTSGIYVYDTLQQRFRYGGLKGYLVRHIYADELNNYWISTYGTGLFFMSASTGRIIQIPADRNNYLGKTHYIIADSLNRFWFATNNGLFLSTMQCLRDYLEKNENPWYYRFTVHDGLPSNEFNAGQPSYLQHTNGYVSLPTIDGLAWFKPEEIQPVFPVNKLRISMVMPDGSLSEVDSAITLNNRKDQGLTLKVISFNWLNSNNNVIEYSSSSDKRGRWRELGDDGIINLSSLKGGKHSIYLRQRTGFGAGDFLYQELVITVPAAWYETVVVYVIGMLFIMAGFLIYFERRKRILNKRNEELNMKITEATTDLILLNDELTKTNQLKNKLISIVNHDIYFAVSTLNKQAAEIKQQSEKGVAYPEGITTLFKMAGNLQSMTDYLLEWVATQRAESEILIKKEKVDLADTISVLLDSQKTGFLQNGITVQNNLPQHILVETDKKLITIILFNVISNVIKHSRDCRFTIKFSSDVFINTVYLEFKNNITQLPEANSSQSRARLGLKIIREFCTSLDILFEQQIQDDIFTVRLGFTLKSAKV